MLSMNFIKAVLILCTLVCMEIPQGNAAIGHTVKGLVITPDGTVVPEFTVVVKHLTDKPELVRRMQFTDGEFEVEAIGPGKYQLQVTAPMFIGAQVVFDFIGRAPDTDYRIVILHPFRTEARLMPGAAYSVSVKTLKQKAPDSARQAYEQAIELHREGKLDEALIEYGKALRNYPRYLEALTDIGTIFLLYNRPEAALS